MDHAAHTSPSAPTRTASLASRLLVFRSDKAQGKPENIRNVNGWCPFCHPEQLTNVFRREGDLIWLMNKYRTIEDTAQTIIVESADHVGDPSNYTAAEMRRILRFSIECWHEMKRSGRYERVLMFKNFGPLSGGSLRHPHMQIVGLQRDAGTERSVDALLDGVEAWGSTNARALVATRPFVGPAEITLVARDQRDPACLDELADLLRASVSYLLGIYHGGRCGSYNLFFFEDEGAWRTGHDTASARLVCRVVPRWPVSPYQIGYAITQVSSHDELARIAAELRPVAQGARAEGDVSPR
ncbi:MAG: DUF4931 domain-containing protein [Coriobacteriia bacterium]|nr:DUF4931 domain-containing protein [Coriobacteriia bacterium]MBS5478318.1 DUF4931 domain-containing protein [Coriobacteriia bacterium]